MKEEIKISESDLIENFPFKEIRPKQLEGMKQIAQAINEGYKIIVLEAPTGFGKSPVAVGLGRTLGSSYICSATTELQSQYVKDFPFLRSVKGMGKFDCLVREDLILNKTYRCKSCDINQRENSSFSSSSNIVKECDHTTVDYGPCRESDNNTFEHVPKNCDLCRYPYVFSDGDGDSDNDNNASNNSNAYGINTGFHSGCRYRTFKEDYVVTSRNTDEELIFITPERAAKYHKHSTDNSDSMTGWLHLKNITNENAIENRTLNDFTPCPYYDQLHKGLLASHTIFNYANFLIFLRRSGATSKNPVLKNRRLLVLDEGHQIENQIVSEIGITVSKRTLNRYIMNPNYIETFENCGLDYDSDIETDWLKLLLCCITN